MTTALLALTFFRIWGAWILVFVSASIPVQILVSSVTGGPQSLNAVLPFLSSGLQILFGVLLIRFAPELSARLFPIEERLGFNLTVSLGGSRV